MMKHFKEYICAVAQVKDENEHSGRTYLQNLLHHFSVSHGITVVQESKSDKNNNKGVPDFKFSLHDTDIGYLENKKIGENLDVVLKSSQIRKYKTLTDNLLVTDYLRWIWIYKDKIIRDVRLSERTVLDLKDPFLSDEKCHELTALINDFLSQKQQPIIKAQDLAEKLSKPTRTIKEDIKNIVDNAQNYHASSRIIGTFQVFKTEISENITPEEFSDAFAQTLTYSLFLTKITLTKAEKLTLSNITHLTPKSFSLIRDILTFIHEIDDYPQLKPYIDRILHIINHIDAYEISKDLQNTKNEYEDPYIHFYENFLTAYDKQKRKDLGVWYTPKPVVRSIITMIHEILQDDFDLSNGLADTNIKLLDFACGTGTFLYEVYDKILSEISPTSLKRTSLIRNHILKNLYGFEMLIPAYCVSHLKLSQYLKDQGYELSSEERIKIYFTNTLENRHPDRQENLNYAHIFPAMADEGKIAQNIKDDNEIIVITGNPPYNVKSKNILEGVLLEFHKTYKNYPPKEEKNINSLNDDYIKFIAFAHRKIKNAGRGIFGLIVNNSFLKGLTHRKMRNELLKDFDKIYIINLHGGGIVEGIKDENIFDIKQNVCIVIFIKNEHIKDKGVYYKDLIGKRKDKFNALMGIKYKEFPRLNITEFNTDFKQTEWGKNRFSDDLSFFYPIQTKTISDYGKFIGLTDIFKNYNSGIKGERDKILSVDFAVCFSKEKIHTILQDFQNLSADILRKKYHIKDNRDWKLSVVQRDVIQRKNIIDNIEKILYRPFDYRYIDYTQDKTKALGTYLRQDFFNNMLQKDNIGLCFIRNDYNSHDYNFVYVSSHIIDIHLIGGQTYFAPLYTYVDNDLLKSEKILNFKPEFARMVAQKFDNPRPEEVLAYIYAVLHSVHYRTDYLEFLRIDFPRIPFDIDVAEFKRLSILGQELIDVHLMKKIPVLKVGEPEKDGIENYTVETVTYDDKTQRLYFNKNCYFSDVQPEVWDFTIDGYQVLDEYLKSRKTMDIMDDLPHIQNIIKVLTFTLQKVQEL